MQILTIRKGLETFECKFKSFEKDLKHSNQIRTIRKGFEAFQCKFNNSKGTRGIRMQILTIQIRF